MERVNLVRNERTRYANYRALNNSFVRIPPDGGIASRRGSRCSLTTIIKADVRGSTKITCGDLQLARRAQSASLFSLNFYEPVKRILDRYGAARSVYRR